MSVGSSPPISGKVNGNRGRTQPRLNPVKRKAVTLAMVLVVAACGESIGSGSTPSTSLSNTTTASSSISAPRAGVISVGDLGVIVPPDDAGEYPPDLKVTCGGSGPFPLSALAGIEPLDQVDPGGVTEAIEPFLDSEEGQYWPQEGWHVLHQTHEEVLLVVKVEGSLSFMNVSNDGSGWRWAGSSGGGEHCLLEFVYPESINAVTWILDPARPPLTEESTEIGVVLNEVECVDGREIRDRLLPPEIVMTETQVFMAFAAETPPGTAFTCPGNPDTPYVAELPAPLGDRILMPGVELGIDLAEYVPAHDTSYPT